MRRVYRNLLKSDDHGFNLESGYVYLLLYSVPRFDPLCLLFTHRRSVFNSPENSAVFSRVVKEVQTLNPAYQASITKGKLSSLSDLFLTLALYRSALLEMLYLKHACFSTFHACLADCTCNMHAKCRCYTRHAWNMHGADKTCTKHA